MALTWPNSAPAFGQVMLRPFRDSDLHLVAELSADPYLPQTGSIPAVYTEQAGLAYIARQHQRLTEESGYSFVIADRTNGRGLGGAGLWLQAPTTTATLGYAVAPSARRRGVATDALTALTAFGWTLPQLDRLELYIEPWNTGSIRAAERAGYGRDALLRRHTLIGGTRRDVLRYLLLRP